MVFNAKKDVDLIVFRWDDEINDWVCTVKYMGMPYWDMFNNYYFQHADEIKREGRVVKCFFN